MASRFQGLTPMASRYGFLSPGSKMPLEEVRARIELAFGFELAAPELEPEPPPQIVCRHCGHELVYRYSILPYRRRSLTAAPSG